MRDLARLGAALCAVLVLLRDHAIAPGTPALWQATYLCAAVVVAGLSLFRDGFATASGVALGGHYLLALNYGDVTADLGAPIVAGLVVLHLDLLDLALSVPRERAIDPAFLRSRLRHAAFVFGLGVVAGSVAVLVATVDWPSSTLTRAIGVAGVALAVVIPLGMLRARR
ncbi:MAG TPA: hypothetical protein VGX28_02390 [Frankiaceae bacterium]|jgi:hypothetical protein|nr:hypothetical protein [Frankiaceae bacterium]